MVPLRGQEPLFLNQSRARQFHKEQISIIGVPIILQGAPLGVLSVDRLFADEVPPERRSLRFLGILAAILAQFVALELPGRLREERLRPEISPRARVPPLKVPGPSGGA